MTKPYTIISLGGSIIAPDAIDTAYLKQFVAVIQKQVTSGQRFIIITGGGKLSRTYQGAIASIVGKASSEDLDWLGIYATRVHAQMLRIGFGPLAYKNILEIPNKKIVLGKPIAVAGGWKPGRSTDDVAVHLAESYGATTVINLTNVDYVYTKNPKEFPDAEKIETISWKDFRNNIIGATWKPGANMPFDPVAAKLAEKLKLKVVVANGKDLKNLENIVAGKGFVGTMIA